MKLKKIASLALAGIMAVSMLTACGEGGNGNNGEDVPPETVVTTGIADAANGERSNYIKNSMKVTYTESDSVNSALAAAVASEYKTADIKIALDDTDYDYAKYQSGSTAGEKVATKVYESLTGTSTNNQGFNGLQRITTVGTKKSVVVYAVGGNYDADDAAALVSHELNTQFVANSTPIDTTGYKADYTVELGAVKATSAEDASLSIWVVAVVLTQTVSSAS